MSLEAYIDSKKYAWAPLTLKKESSRLRVLLPYIDGNPESLWEFLESYKPYTRVTAWTRAADYWKFKTGQDVYHNWRKENARVFKNTYQRRAPAVSYSEAKELLSKISDPEVKQKAYQLLKGGLRYRESTTIQSGYIVGKGSKKRRVFTEEVPFSKSYEYFWKRLKEETGLKPHDLRKIRIMDLCDKGARPEEICEIAGWSDYSTAQSYIKVNNNRLAQLMED